jgi:spermidine/putrescine transport system substrate-binding protein
MTTTRNQTGTPSPEQSPLLGRSVSRRGFLRGVALGGGLALGSGVLAACGTQGAATSGAKSAKDLSATQKVVNFSNWPLYIDLDEKTKKHPTLDEFKTKDGITVHYTEDINDNDEFFGKIRPQLAAGQDTGRDLIVLTDWMAARLIRLGWVQKLDKSKIPNASNLQDALQHPDFDKSRDYTLPWQSGLTGIAYNPKATGGKKITSVGQLFSDPSLKGKVTALTEMRDSVGLVMLDQGKDPANFTDADFTAAIDALKKATDSGQIRQFTGNDYAQGLASGDIAACLAWSGDVVQLQADNPDIAFVIPDAGAMLWSDNMMIPNLAQHKANAEKLMNYYYDPAVQAQVEDYVNYICPVKGTKEALQKLDPDVANNPLIFPDDATLAKTHIFKGLTQQQEDKYNKAFQAVVGA